MGKTFTLDPISKRRLDNFGEEDQFYIRDHHEAIISDAKRASWLICGWKKSLTKMHTSRSILI